MVYVCQLVRARDWFEDRVAYVGAGHVDDGALAVREHGRLQRVCAIDLVVRG